MLLMSAMLTASFSQSFLETAPCLPLSHCEGTLSAWDPAAQGFVPQTVKNFTPTSQALRQGVPKPRLLS